MTGMEDAVESALRTLMADLDYDLHKALECDEETGRDWYPGHAAVFAEALALAGFGNLHDAWADGRKSLMADLAGTPRYGTPGYKETPNPYPAPKVSET